MSGKKTARKFRKPEEESEAHKPGRKEYSEGKARREESQDKNPQVGYSEKTKISKKIAPSKKKDTDIEIVIENKKKLRSGKKVISKKVIKRESQEKHDKKVKKSISKSPIKEESEGDQSEEEGQKKKPKPESLEEYKPLTRKELSKPSPVRSIFKKKEIKQEEEHSSHKDPSISQDSKSKSVGVSASESIIRKSTKQQFSGKVDTQSISDEISKIIKKIEHKKQLKQDERRESRKLRKADYDKKFTAKNHNYELQKASNMTVNHFIDIFELSEKIEYKNSDIILAIIEIALNSAFYKIPYSNRSNHFWEEVVLYNQLKRLFQFYRPETIKKYWRLINYKNNAEKCADVVISSKKFIDEKNPKY